MAGNPKKRARRAEAKAAAAEAKTVVPPPTAPPVPDDPPVAISAPAPVPDPVIAQLHPPETHTAAPPAAAPAPAPERRPVVTTRRAAPGAVTRSTVDHIEADQIARLANVLRPGLNLSIERTRPGWCSGWVGDFEAQDGDITELREYIAEEFGGQRYRVAVEDATGGILFTATMKIAGQPRRDGIEIDRRAWEGRPDVNPQPAPPADGGNNIAAMGQIFQGLLNVTTHTADKTLRAVEAMNRNQSEQTTKLIETIVNTREKTAQSGSFVHTLQEVKEANEAMRDIRDAISEDYPGQQPAHQDENLLSGVLKDATKDLLATGLKKQIGTTVRNPGVNSPVDLPPAISDPGSDVRRRK